MGLEFIKKRYFSSKGLKSSDESYQIFLLPKGLISSKPIANSLFQGLISKRIYLHKTEVTEKYDKHFKNKYNTESSLSFIK